MSKTESTVQRMAPPEPGGVTPPASSTERPRRTAPWIDPSVLVLAELVVLQGGEVGRRYPVYGGEVIGRSEEADISLDVDEVSRHHCVVRRAARSGPLGAPVLEIEDLDSSNGTTIHGHRVEGTHELAVGDRVVLGGRVELLVAQPEPEQGDQVDLRRYDVTRLVLGSASRRLHEAMGETLAAIDAIRRITDGAPPSAELDAALGTLLGSLRDHGEVSRQLRVLAARNACREGRVNLGALCHDVALNLTAEHPRVAIRDDTRRVEVRGDVVELYEIVDGAARHLLRHLPEDATLHLRCLEAPSPEDPRRRVAAVELSRTAADTVTALVRLDLPTHLLRRVAMHGGRVEALDDDALGHRILFPAVTPPRHNTTVRGSTTLADP